MNIRKIAAIIAVGIAVMSVVNVKASAPATIVHTMMLADFESGQFYGAMYDSEDHWTPIALTLYDESATTFEDMLSSDGSEYITGTFELNDRGYDAHIVSIYSTEYAQVLEFAWRVLDDSDIGTIANVVHLSTVYSGTLNGESVEFYGFVTNDSAYVLRDASTGYHGYVLQHGNIVEYAVTTTNYGIFVPIVRN